MFYSLSKSPSIKNCVPLNADVGIPKTNEHSDLVTFNNGDRDIEFRFEEVDQSIWATVQNMADLFGTGTNTIRVHIENIYKDEELQEYSTSSKFECVQIEGGRQVKRKNVNHYNIDVVLSVGYRVNTKKAIAFRQWATQTLRTYLEQGYVINEKALRESPEKLNKLAAQIRALRYEEKQVYAKVRECFKISASDYDPSSKQVKTFYALLQDKFHHAVTGMTGSKLLIDRADYKEDNMGLCTMKSEFPTFDDAKTAKNYLLPTELYRLHILSEQFLLFAESTALTDQKMTMDSLHKQLDRLLTLNNYPVFSGYTDYLKDDAISHAKMEFELYKKRLKIERLGYEFDEYALELGEYDEILSES